MTKLILATESFPYGKGERTFILPELERLRQYFDITIVSHANRDQIKEGISEELPKDIKVVCLARPQLTALDKVRALISVFTDRDGRMEVREILAGKADRRVQFYQSLAFYAQARADQKKLRQSGILSVEEPVIYYAFWYTYFCYSMIREKRRYPNVHVVTRTHGVDLYHERVPGGRQPFRHQMEKQLDAILFACEYGAGYYAACAKDKQTSADKLHVCKLGIEGAGRQMPVGRSEEWELLSCSNVLPLKRIHLIIDGLAQIQKAKIHWTHIGDGSELADMERYAAEKLKDKDNIRYTFTGFLKDVHAYYQHNQVDCFITTSATEGGCPVSIQEAMSCGIPVIGTDVGGITEMIRDNGILLSAEPDQDEVAGAILGVMTQERHDLEKMKAAAYRKWKEEFDIHKSFEKVLRILQICLYDK